MKYNIGKPDPERILMSVEIQKNPCPETKHKNKYIKI